MAVDVSKIPNNSKFDPVREAILKLQKDVRDGVSGVATVNSSDGNITITNSGNITVGTVGETITIGINDSTYLTSADISDFITLTDLSVTTSATPSGGGALSYDDTTGVFTFTPADAGTGLTLQQVTANGNTTTYGISTGNISVQPAGTGSGVVTIQANSVGDARVDLTPGSTAGDGVIRTTIERAISFRPFNTEKVVIASDGNMNVYEKLAVGKTTAASTYPLEVNGAVLASDFKAQTTVGGVTYTGTVDQYYGSLQIRTDSGGTISLGGSGTGSVQNNVFIKDGDLDVNGDVTADFFIGDGSQLTNISTSDTLQDVTDNGATTTNDITIQYNGLGLQVENSLTQGADTGIRIRGARNGQTYASDILTSYILFSNHDNNTTPNNYDLAKIGAGMYDAADDTGYFQIQVNDGTSLVKALDIEKNKDATFYGNLDVNGKLGIGTSAPVDKVQIDAANSQLRLRDTDDGTYTQFSSSGNLLAIRQNSTTASHFWMNSSGEIGLGTNSPSAKLHSTGEIRTEAVFHGIGVDSAGNIQPASNNIRVSGYGIIGNRGTFYVTNGGGAVQIGNGNIHNQSPTASFASGGISLQRSTSITGNLTFSGDSRGINLSGGTTSSQNYLIIGEQNLYGVRFRWDSGASLHFDGYWNTSTTGAENRDLGYVDVNNRQWFLESTILTSALHLDHVYHRNDTNTYMQFHAADQWRVVTGGAERLEVNNTQTTISQAARITGDLTVNGDIYGKSVNGAWSNLYRMGGVYFTWDSDSYGTNFNHSITSTYNGNYGDHITLNSYGHVRINIDSNGNGTNTFSIGRHSTGTGNTMLTLNESSELTVNGNVRTPIFYDSDNTNYYLNPASTSIINILRVGTTDGVVRMQDYSNGLSGAGELELRANGGTGWASGDTIGRIRFYLNDGSGVGVRDVARIEAVSEDGNGSTTTTPSGALSFYISQHNSQVNEGMRLSSDNYLIVYGSARSPIFYDSDNTAYYLNAASTSRLNQTTTNYVNVAANAAYAVRFWNGSHNYSIRMSGSSSSTYGGRVAGETTSDYNMYFTMAGGTNRGFVFRNSTASTGCVAGIDASGNGRFKGDVIAYASSDKRLKDNITPIENPIDKVQKISGVNFDWNDKQDTYEHGKHDVGVVAQEIEEVLPEVVDTRENGYKAVKYEKIVPLLIEAIKEQQKQIDELKSLINK